MSSVNTNRKFSETTDHLGNTRVRFKADNEEAISLENIDYYPFGLTTNIQRSVHESNEDYYLYNGKELYENLDLDWYDYGFRMYDPEIVRWHVVDPMVEKYFNQSPYVYASNNPMLRIDPDGQLDFRISKKYDDTERPFDWTDIIFSDEEKQKKEITKEGAMGGLGVLKYEGEKTSSSGEGVTESTSSGATGEGATNVLGDVASSGGTFAADATYVAQNIFDGTANVLSHPGTSVALQFGDDALRAIGLAKAIPGINIAANAAGAYVYANDMGNSNLSVERKAYRTMSNGVPLVLSVGAMVGAFGTGTGEAAVIIGAVGYVGEQVYDRVYYPALQYTSQKVYEFESWFKSGGYNSMYSDQNLKGNIVLIDSSLNKLMLINGYSFEWKDSIVPEEGHDIGLLAQEIEKIYPELVVSDSAGYKKIYYYKLIPVMVEAIKEQQRTIDSQNVLLINYQNDIKENEELLNDVLIRLEELEKGKKKKNK